MVAPSIDDEEVRALASRLRQSGWTERSPTIAGEVPAGRYRRHLKTHKVEPDAGFGVLDGGVKAAGAWLAQNRDAAEWPIRQFMADKFGLSYDDAGRAVAEAERLSGESL